MKPNLLTILFGHDVDQKGASFADTLRAMLSPKAAEDDAYQQLKQVRRVHRRLEAILLHPLSHKVVQEVNREQLEAARNALRASLGYSESLGRALGQQSADDEIEVRL